MMEIIISKEYKETFYLLKELLANDSLVNYDMKNTDEISRVLDEDIRGGNDSRKNVDAAGAIVRDAKENKSNHTAFYRAILYKWKAGNVEKKKIDCDRVKLVKLILEIIIQVNGIPACKSTDTMTSFWTTLKAYLKNSLGISCVPVDNRLFGNSKESWFIYLLQKNILQKVNDKISEECNCFLEANHTIGNFTVIPEGINQARSNFGRFDYWDLFLENVYDYYHGKRDLVILQKNDRAKKVLGEWLDLYGSEDQGWKEFIKKNLFQDYVKEGIPIKFYDTHSMERPVPLAPQDIKMLFETAENCIKARGERIRDLLEENINNIRFE